VSMFEKEFNAIKKKGIFKRQSAFRNESWSLCETARCDRLIIGDIHDLWPRIDLIGENSQPQTRAYNKVIN
jgi:hypothetical protein